MSFIEKTTRGTSTLTSAALIVCAGCSSSGIGTQRGALASMSHATFMHAGFGAGPVVFTDDTGRLLEERRYEPFGAPVDAHLRSAGGDTIGGPDLVARDLNPLNKRSDAATGWSDHGARWLAPETGRWLTPDPAVAGPDATFMVAPWGLHPYQYADQNPVVYWDPDGRSPAAAAVAQDAPAVPPIIVGVLRFGAAIGGAFVRGLPIAGLIAAPVASVVQHAQHPEDFPLECDGCEIIKLELELQDEKTGALSAADAAEATDAAKAQEQKTSARLGIAVNSELGRLPPDAVTFANNGFKTVGWVKFDYLGDKESFHTAVNAALRKADSIIVDVTSWHDDYFGQGEGMGPFGIGIGDYIHTILNQDGSGLSYNFLGKTTFTKNGQVVTPTVNEYGSISFSVPSAPAGDY